jgi:pimeloyl-ACP methyl ester carboxylesterase
MPFVERPDGARLFVEVAGDPARDAIVLIGGLGADLSVWRPNVPHLSAELFVVAYDHRGCGRSEPGRGPATMDTYAQDGLAVLDDLRVGRAHVYGMSFGGAVALELVLTHPERARTVVLAAATPGRAHAVPSGGRAPKDKPWLQRYAPTFVEAHPELARASPDARSRAGERAQWEALNAWDAEDRLGQIAVPLLVLHGSEDLLVHPDNARRLADRIPGAELAILEGAGHAINVEQPERADALVLDFVRRHSG